MNDPIYIVKNQHGQFISKQKEWLDGSEPKLLFRTKHHDEALNLVFELSLKDVELRACHEVCEIDEKGQPIVEVTYQPPLVFDEENGEEATLEASEETDQDNNSSDDVENIETETSVIATPPNANF